MLFLDDAHVRQVFKETVELNIIIKKSPQGARYIFIFYYFQYLFVNFTFEEWTFLPFTINHHKSKTSGIKNNK